VALEITGLLCFAQPLRWLDGLETRLVDLRFAVRGARLPCEKIAIVKIDDAAVHRYPSLPTDPRLHAELIRRLRAAGVAAIGLDIPELARPALDDPPGPGHNLSPYEELTAVLAEAGRVVLPVVWVGGGSQGGQEVPAPVRRFSIGGGRLTKPVELRNPRVLHPRADLCAAAAGLGTLNVYPDRDWTVRQAPLLFEAGGQLYPSLALEMARVASGAPATVSRRGKALQVSLGSARFLTDAAGEVPINYAGPAETYPMFAYEDLVEGDGVPADLARQLRGKLVLVGSTAAAESSRLRTPYSPYMTGVELNANVLDMLLTGRTLRSVRTREAVLLTILAAALAWALSLWLRPRQAALAIGLSLVGALGASSLAFYAGYCLPTAGPLLAILLVGGDKTGDKRFYDRMIPVADRLYEEHLEDLRKKGRI